MKNLKLVFSSMLNILLALLVGMVVLLFISKEPIATLKWFFLGPFTNFYFFGNMLAASIPLIFTGLAASVGFHANVFNLGLEGQYYFGAIVGTVIGLNVSKLGLFSIPFIILMSFSIGSLLFLPSVLLRLKFGFSELISSFMIGQIFIYVGDFFLNGPLRDPQAALSATKYLDETARLPKILPPSNLHVGYVIGIGLCFLAHSLYKHAVIGYEFKMVRGNPRFANVSGMNVAKILSIAAIFSGGLAAMGGMIDVLGVHGRVVRGFSHGNGFNGIAVSLLVKNKPLLIVFSALFFAYMESGAEIASMMVQTPPEISKVIQGVVFCLVTAENVLLWRKKYDLDSTA
ncbi:ABC transporter permease [Pseudothermotoga sp.]